ncbi:hypothetical protein PENSPDRAFT_755981 [Peniophora sp. CONT]|nr:hypothetical protein PENSPDRAFT_755981 [Peniophora sp. CONT]
MATTKGLDEAAYSYASRNAWSSFIATRFDTHGRTSERTARLRMAELELESLRAFAVVAKRCRNAATSCGCLPPEVLAVVFAYAQEVWRPHRVWQTAKTEKAGPRYALGWMSILHVSSSWRKAALDTPRLWTQLHCFDIMPQLMAKVLLSSRNLPLKVYVDDRGWLDMYSSSMGVSPGWLCAPVIKRMEKLVIATQDNELRTWTCALKTTAPALKELELEARGPRDEAYHLEDTLFVGDVPPLLTSLSLTACFPRWNSRLFTSNLTKLRLSMGGVFIDIFRDESTRVLPSSSRLKRILSPLQSLIELYLHNLFPRDEPGAMDVPLSLPSTLRIFECTCDNWDAFNEHYSNLWRCVKAPADAVIICEAFVDGLSDHPSSIYHHLLEPLLNANDPAHPTRELYLSQNTLSLRNTAQARAGWTWRWPDEPRQINKYDQPITSQYRKDLVYDGESGSRHIRAWAWFGPEILVEAPPMDTLQAVYFSSDVMHLYGTPAKWLDCFSDADSEVERIAIPYINSLDLLSALVDKTEDDAFSLFPKLRIIVVHPGSQYMEKADIHHGGVDLSLAHLIEVRRREGLPIEELLVDNALASWGVWGRIREMTTVNFFE